MQLTLIIFNMTWYIHQCIANKTGPIGRKYRPYLVGFSSFDRENNKFRKFQQNFKIKFSAFICRQPDCAHRRHNTPIYIACKAHIPTQTKTTLNKIKMVASSWLYSRLSKIEYRILINEDLNRTSFTYLLVFLPGRTNSVSHLVTAFCRNRHQCQPWSLYQRLSVGCIIQWRTNRLNVRAISRNI